MDQTNKVVPLFDGCVLPDEPVPCVVEILETLLSRAKAGDIIGIAYATVNKCVEDGVGCGWKQRDDQGLLMGAAIQYLQARWLVSYAD